MWRVVLLVFCYHVVSQSQPVTDEPSVRHTRELIECCPCPGSIQRGPDMLGRSLDRAIDDCPCRAENTDSEGASSFLFPTRTAAGKSINTVPFMRSNDPKDEMKNFLDPEVGLATSMLQTLREATEEEYRDALARDAARSIDAVPEESANVVIIVKPRASDDEDIFVSEASNVKEARCIQPLGRMRTSKPLKTLPDFFRLPKARQPGIMHNLWNMDNNVGASNVQENVVNMDGGAAGRTRPLFKLGTPFKENNLLKSITNVGSDKVPSLFKKVEQSIRNRPIVSERFPLPRIPKMNVDPLQKAKNNINSSDLISAPSDDKGCVENKNGKRIFKFNKRPLMLKEILKLKDVELIPKTTPKRPIFKSHLNNKELSLNRDADDKCEDSTNGNVLMPKNVQTNENFEAQNGDNSFQNIAESVIESEENNQDALTSPSKNIPIIIDNTQTVDSDEIDCDDFSAEEIIKPTTGPIAQIVQENDGLNETLDPTQLSEIEDITDNETDSNISKSCDSDNDLSNEDSDASSNNNNDDEDSIEQGIAKHLAQEPGSDEIVEEIDIPQSKVTAASEHDTFKDLQKLSDNLLDSRANKLQNPTPNESEIEDELNEHQINETPLAVTFRDLQKLSDDLLVLSSNDQQNFTPKVSETEDEPDFELNVQQKQRDDTKPGSLEVETSTSPGVGISKFKNSQIAKEKACRVGISKKKTKQKTVPKEAKSVNLDENKSDMSVEASAPTVNILPALLDPLSLNEQLRSSLFQNIDPLDPLNLNEKLASPLLPNLDPLNISERLRPSVFADIDPLNLNEKIPSPLLPNLDPLNVRSSLQNIITQPTISDDPLNVLRRPITEVLKLPTLEDLRERLSSVFDPNYRSAENNFSDEDVECSNDAPEMSFAASTNNLRKVPSMRPLEDFNVDVFQLNPLSSSQPDFMSNVPRLNLNNFRTKLPIPTNLDLKPVKLESRVGNNKGNILGASLTFGPNKSRNYKPINSNLLGQPLGNLPSLDELRNTLHSSTKNLLAAPLQPSLDLFKDSPLRSSGIPDLDEIRRNAEKTMKGLQQRMKSTFKGGKLHNPLNEKFARPQDLLEDVNDKLKAIHYDLNDRLSSFHEDFLEQSRFKPLEIPARIPTFPNRNSNRNVMSTIRKTKGKPLRLQTSASTISSQDIDPFENTGKNLLRSQANNLKRVHTSRQGTLAGAESSPVATKIEVPKHRIALSPLSQRLPSLRQGSENIFSENRKPFVLPKPPGFSKDLRTLRKPNPFKETSPFKDSKVTITFATTTQSPVTSYNEKYRTSSIKQNKPSILRNNNESLKERLITLPKAKTFGNAKQSASELTPLRMSNPVKSKNNFKTANSDIKNLPQHQNLESIENIKPKLSSFKSLKDPKLRLNDNNANRLNSAWAYDNKKPKAKSVDLTERPIAKSLVWPKSNEDSFLAKVRDAMQARLANFGSTRAVGKAVNVEKVEKLNTDMLRSASEHNDVLMEDPLKENVPYKCRMVCTREN